MTASKKNTDAKSCLLEDAMKSRRTTYEPRLRLPEMR